MAELPVQGGGGTLKSKKILVTELAAEGGPPTTPYRVYCARVLLLASSHLMTRPVARIMHHLMTRATGQR